MAIQNLKTIRRFQDLAATGDLTDVTSYNFRSLEEVKEFVNQIMKSAQDDIKDIKDFKRLFEPANFRKLQMDYIAAAIKKVGKKPVQPKMAPKPLKGIQTITQDADAPAKKPKVKVKEGESIPVEFIAPAGKDLTKKFEAMNRLHRKVQSLDDILVKIAYEHHDDPKLTGETTRLVKTSRDKLQKELIDAYAFLETTAKKTEPKQFRLTTKHIIDKVTETFKDTFESYKQYVYVTPKTVMEAGKQTILFVYNHYLEIKNFQMDTGDIYPKYFIVFTGIVNPSTSRMTMHFSTFTAYPPPGSFIPVHEFTKESNGLRDLLITLEQENFSTFIERVPVEITGPELRKMKWNVPKGMIRHMSVELNVISFSLDPSLDKEEAYNIQAVLSRELVQQAIPVTKGHLAMRAPYKQKGTNVWILDFVVLKPSRQHMKNIRLTQDKIDTLVRILDITPQQAADLVKSWNRLPQFLEDPDLEETKEEQKGKPAIKPLKVTDVPSLVKSKSTKGILKEAMADVLKELDTRYQIDELHNTIMIDSDFHFQKDAIKSMISKALKGTKLKLDRVRSLPNDLALFLTDTTARQGFNTVVVSFEPRKHMKVV